MGAQQHPLTGRSGLMGDKFPQIERPSRGSVQTPTLALAMPIGIGIASRACAGAGRAGNRPLPTNVRVVHVLARAPQPL